MLLRDGQSGWVVQSSYRAYVHVSAFLETPASKELIDIVQMPRGPYSDRERSLLHAFLLSLQPQFARVIADRKADPAFRVWHHISKWPKISLDTALETAIQATGARMWYVSADSVNVHGPASATEFYDAILALFAEDDQEEARRRILYTQSDTVFHSELH